MLSYKQTSLKGPAFFVKAYAFIHSLNTYLFITYYVLDNGDIKLKQHFPCKGKTVMIKAHRCYGKGEGEALKPRRM